LKTLTKIVVDGAARCGIVCALKEEIAMRVQVTVPVTVTVDYEWLMQLDDKSIAAEETAEVVKSQIASLARKDARGHVRMVGALNLYVTGCEVRNLIVEAGDYKEEYYVPMNF
jgi:hypothetical protein